MTAQTPSAGDAGYSGTPLHRKLGVKPGHRVLVVGAPIDVDLTAFNPDVAATLLAVSVVDCAAAPAEQDIVVAFCPDRTTLTAVGSTTMERTAIAGRCWVAWPKRASGRQSDLSENVVRDFGLAAGWVDVKVCAIDQTWSGLCLVRRLKDR